MRVYSQPIYLLILPCALVDDTTFYFLQVTEKEIHLVPERKKRRGGVKYQD